jgi:hypothetical protein
MAPVGKGGTPLITVDATQGSGKGGYAGSVIARMMATKILFTAKSTADVQDNVDNDYALAGVNVSAVPIPAAAWLFVSGIVGLMGFSTRRKAA